MATRSCHLQVLALGLVFLGACASTVLQPASGVVAGVDSSLRAAEPQLPPPGIAKPRVSPNTAFAVDKEGNQILGGAFVDKLAFAPQLDSPGRAGAYVAKVRPDGRTVWAHQLGGSGSAQVSSIVLDAQDNVYVLGTFEKEVTLADQRLKVEALASKPAVGIFVAKLNRAGALQWLRQVARASYADGVTGALRSVRGSAGATQEQLVVSIKFSGQFQVGQGAVTRYPGLQQAMINIGADGAVPTQSFSPLVFASSLDCYNWVVWYYPDCKCAWTQTCQNKYAECLSW